MSDLPDIAALSAWMLRVDRELRDLATGNPLNRGSVQSADGRQVPLSAIAFGQVVIQDPRDTIGLTGSLNTAAGTGWVDKGGPYLDVYVTGGQLRVDFSTQLTVDGIQPFGGMSYTLRGPSTTQPGAAAAPVIAPGDTWRTVGLGDGHSSTEYVNLTSGGSAFGVHKNLAPGWYRISAVYTLSYSSGPTYVPHANFYGVTMAATPL